MEIKKPETFQDLLYLQSVLDDEVAKPRENSFVPRKREELDILLSIDDEFNEWLKELPKIYNFKTWKQKEYDLEKELEELTDILFFFLQYFNHKKIFTERMCSSVELSSLTMKMNKIENIFLNKYEDLCSLSTRIHLFKHYLWSNEILNGVAFEQYMYIVNDRSFSTQDLINKYWEKWQTNMKRINGDWTL